MKSQGQLIKHILSRVTLIISIVSILVSCQLLPGSVNNTESMPSQVSAVAPPSLPETFQTYLLNPLDTPNTYVEETCRSLRNKWNPLNAAPGTVVMIILFKNINRGTAELQDSVSVIDFLELMNQLQAQGFEAINTDQLQSFMERNVEIPPRSVLLIQDGNQSAEYYDKNFREFFEMWGWGVTNGWVADPDVSETLLRENINLEYEGFIDHQARGTTSYTTLSDESAKPVIARELQSALNGFADQFGKTPTAVIWPNGGFGYRPVEAARQLRYKLGFTANARGPIMYNWVPLAETADPERPGLIPEGQINDPLMTLPTYSPGEALAAIDLVRAIGEAAAEYAQANRDNEFTYYEIMCESEFGPMPSP
ncbi:MAG: hypothetical protein JNK32_08530 [Anaerolineales bacterium]|nr:hypothetical protein [Anaerolineales bacterium]